MHEQIAAWKTAGKRISFVPTMGALHQAHLSLMELGRAHGDCVVLSIFVNPTQFNSAEDLAKYPRTLEADLKLARDVNVDLVFTPTVEEIYPHGAAATRVVAGDASSGLCGATRPGHFDGVVTVVAILFNIVQPDVAVFGEKDFQQSRVVQQLVRDLHYPIEIVIGPTVRDTDGLALSSRNARLTPHARERALAIPQALQMAHRFVLEHGATNAADVISLVREHLQRSPEIRVAYVEVVDRETVGPVATFTKEAQLCVAAFVDGVRLIDNVRLSVRE